MLEIVWDSFGGASEEMARGSFSYFHICLTLIEKLVGQIEANGKGEPITWENEPRAVSVPLVPSVPSIHTRVFIAMI